MGKKKPQEKQPEPEVNYEAFFSGLPYESTENDLRQFLGTSDGIISIKMPRYQDSNRCRGYAHIKFDNKEAYQNALSKHGNDLGGRYLTVTQAKGEKHVTPPPSIPAGCKVLFVKGLPYEIKEEDLNKEFSSAGNIKDIRMVRNSVNKKFKGFAYIEYKQASSLVKAIKKYHNKNFEGRRLICDASITSMKKGYKKRNEYAQEMDNQQEDQQ